MVPLSRAVGPQARARDAADRRPDRRGDGARLGPRQPGRPGRPARGRRRGAGRSGSRRSSPLTVADRQAGVLPSRSSSTSTGAYELTPARDGRERAGRRRPGGDERLPGEAPADLVGELAQPISPARKPPPTPAKRGSPSTPESRTRPRHTPPRIPERTYSHHNELSVQPGPYVRQVRGRSRTGRSCCGVGVSVLGSCVSRSAYTC